MGFPKHKDGSLDWSTMGNKTLDFWIFGYLIGWILFFWNNVLSGTPNTVSIDEGDLRYFGTAL